MSRFTSQSELLPQKAEKKKKEGSKPAENYPCK